MSHAQVILDTGHEDVAQDHYVFDEPKTCVIGRADNCDIQLSGDVSFANVSRHHCELDIDPPSVRIRDLGSRNGTWLNGRRLNQGAQYLENTVDREPGEYVALNDGDEFHVGFTEFRVSIVATEGSALGEVAPLPSLT